MQQEQIYVGLPIHQLTKLNLKKTNSNSTDVIFTGARFNRMIAKH